MFCFVLQIVDLPDETLATISVPVGDICIAGCRVLVHINIPRQEKDVTNPLNIPTSIFNDPAMPHTVSLDGMIPVEQVGNMLMHMRFYLSMFYRKTHM